MLVSPRSLESQRGLSKERLAWALFLSTFVLLRLLHECWQGAWKRQPSPKDSGGKQVLSVRSYTSSPHPPSGQTLFPPSCRIPSPAVSKGARLLCWRSQRFFRAQRALFSLKDLTLGIESINFKTIVLKRYVLNITTEQ